MTYLLDVNVIYNAIWNGQAQHEAVWNWLEGKTTAICPLAELGFVRISTHPKIGHVPMKETRAALEIFLTERRVQRIPDDLPALESAPKNTAEVTDSYLAALAEKHGLKLATLDAGIKHPAAVLLSSK